MTTKTTTTKTTRPNLETRLNDRRNDAINLLDQIRNHVATYGTNCPTDWGHVGTMGHVVELLEQLAETCGLRNDA